MLFYFLFAIAIGCSKAAPARRLALSAALIGGFSALAAMLSPLLPALRFYNGALMLEFLSGILLGALYLSRTARCGPVWYAGLVAGFALLWRFWENDWAALAGAVLVVSSALFAPLPPVSALIRLGDASYSLYLTQVLTLPFASLAYKALGLVAAPRAVFVAFALAVAIAGALACYHLFERPADRMLGALIRLKAARTT
jgi:peptidoglycan/LPS O-acetylase OafA/YrhL